MPTQDKVSADRKDKDKGAFTLFLILMPTIFIAMIPQFVNGSLLWPLIAKVLLFGYQYILLKRFVDYSYT